MIRSWFKTTSSKTIGWVAAIAAVVLIATPTAIWFGAASFIFETPQQGLRSFFIVLAIGVFLVVVEIISDLVKEKTKNKR